MTSKPSRNPVQCDNNISHMLLFQKNIRDGKTIKLGLEYRVSIKVKSPLHFLKAPISISRIRQVKDLYGLSSDANSLFVFQCISSH